MEKRQTEPESEEMIDARAIIFDDAGKQNLFLLVRGPYNMWRLPGEIIIRGQESEIESTLEQAFEQMNLGSLEVLPDAKYKTIPKDNGVLFSVSVIKGDSNVNPKLGRGYRECRWVPYETALKSLPSFRQQKAYSPRQQPQKEIFEAICRIKGLRPF